jgi:gliding motility-associated-like protein
MFLISNLSNAQQTYFNGLSARLNPKENVQDSSKKDQINILWIEDIQQRQTHSSIYKSNDGQVKAVSSKRPINYYSKTNELVPIDPDLSKSGKGYWSAENQPFPTYLFPDGSFALTMDNENTLKLGNNCKINGISTSMNVHFNGNNTTIKNVIPSVDKQLLFYENAVKYNYVLNDPLTTIEETLVFSEEIELPKDYRLTFNSEIGKLTENGWMGEVMVLNPKGDMVSTIQVPICVDANNEYILGSFRIEQKNEKWILEMIIPTNWLNDPMRSYPVIIDPLVVGNTSTWQGGNMPSCILPAYNQDSILVIKPGGITITGMYVTASFYADPFTTATMAMGSMYFSTNCGNSQTFTITGSTANMPGTGYLDSFNLFNPLTCCFPETCNPTSIWLSMHLGRTGPGTGCNTTYIRFDALNTLWPFQAVVVGRTAEAYGGKWVVPQIPLCSNTCSITGNAYVNYGVAPYTFTHPWSSDTVTQGVNNGCSTGANYYHFELNIPNCPNYCDTNATTLTVPPPIITDACGTVISAIPAATVPLKAAPNFEPVYDSIVCSGSAFTVDLNPCIPATSINWWGNNLSGNSNFTDSLYNSSTGVDAVNYSVAGTFNGCSSDTISMNIQVQPNPNTNFTLNPEMVILNIPVDMTDATSIYAGSITNWNWSLGNGTTSIDQNVTYTYNEPGTYTVCLKVTTDNGCIDSLCKNVIVAPAEVLAPNVITVNGDDVNDLLIFQYLEFYPDNTLVILNRWGNLVYEKAGYANDWDGLNCTEGTYFYLLKINGEEEKIYSGFFQLIK